MIHFGRSTPVEVSLGDIGAVDTRFPFILFVSQAETEDILDGYLASGGVTVERGVELIDFQPSQDGVHCTLRRHDGQEEQVCASYLVGCDGAHSAVRRGAGIPFEGGQYPQNFVLGGIEVDGPLELNTVHSFPVEGGFAIFFPLGRPATWRVIAMEGNDRDATQEVSPSNELSLDEMQEILDPPTGGLLRLHDPAWLTRFHLHHRQAKHYHLLLCGPPDAWNPEQVAELASHYGGLLRIHYLTRSAIPDALVDGDGKTLARLGLAGAGQYLVRPDSHVGFRCPGRDLRRMTQYLEQWFVSAHAARKNDSLQPL